MDDGKINLHWDLLDLENVMVEATFTNPYSSSEGSWDYGFLVRSGRVNEFHGIVVTSDGFWAHTVRTGTYESSKQVDTGFHSSIRTTATGTNQIRVILQGDTGWLFINDSYITELDVSDWTGSGDVAIITGYFTGNSIPGRSTDYEEFGITAVTKQGGPLDGQLEHEDGFIAKEEVDTRVTNIMLDAQFTNPYATSVGSWDYGFQFRRAGLNDFHAVILTSDGRWVHNVRTGTLESATTVDQGSTSFDTSAEGSNQLRVIAIEEKGWLFINGNLTATLDLSATTKPGTASAITGLFQGDTVLGYSTRFAEFTVWALE